MIDQSELERRQRELLERENVPPVKRKPLPLVVGAVSTIVGIATAAVELGAVARAREMADANPGARWAFPVIAATYLLAWLARAPWGRRTP